MDEQAPPQGGDAPDSTPGGPPPLVSKATAVVGGLTGLMIALAGLFGAFDRLFPGGRDKAPAETQAALDRPGSQAAAGEEPAEAAAEDPSAYTTDNGGTLVWRDGFWVETTPSGEKLRYEEISRDAVMAVAMDPGAGEQGEDVYLRWPINGGPAQESLDRQDTWQDVYELTPVTD